MDLEAMYAEKAEMFRAAVDKQADEEIARGTKEIRERKTAAGKAKQEHELAEALARVRAEKSAAEAKFKKELSRCEFEAGKAVRAHRKELIDGFFEEIREELADFAKSDKYADYLKRAIANAEKELGSVSYIMASPKDVPAVKKLTSVEVREDNSIMLGGICAADEARGLFSDQTLDSALEAEREAFSDKPELRL